MTLLCALRAWIACSSHCTRRYARIALSSSSGPIRPSPLVSRYLPQCTPPHPTRSQRTPHHNPQRTRHAHPASFTAPVLAGHMTRARARGRARDRARPRDRVRRRARTHARHHARRDAQRRGGEAARAPKEAAPVLFRALHVDAVAREHELVFLDKPGSTRRARIDGEELDRRAHFVSRRRARRGEEEAASEGRRVGGGACPWTP